MRTHAELQSAWLFCKQLSEMYDQGDIVCLNEGRWFVLQ